MDATLLKKGFQRDQTHHHMYWFFVGSKRTTIKTRISHGEKEYGDWLLGQMQKQLKLNKAQFDRFMDCPMKLEEYQGILVGAGHVVLEPEKPPPEKASKAKAKKGKQKSKRHK